MVRLQKYLAECGVASRRASEELIASGRVTVNGAPACLGQTVDPAADAVAVDGKPLAEAGQKIYIVLNKPPNCVSTARDTHGRRTVLDCVRGLDTRVYPVGRLDYDVEGVLLLTNDGELAFRLIHPSYEVEKVYLAWVQGRVGDDAVQRLEKGVRLEDGMTAPAGAAVLNAGARTSLLRLTLHEGRKHEVKRMCGAVGHRVQSLRRIAFAGIQADDLRPGEWRTLTPEEVAGLARLVGLPA
ncbi:MAG: rRNA pseudouridine synthase [Candidatus Hydrogenedens sp.]|nr:rRNA pseudouridine synthase [Candidatus Hydrogenedentota bacterium]NLF59236.1 rRNA pseudouridine synthase [Candidatus Hydrogenedens sp.]